MSTETDIVTRIGGVLLDILPADAASITADVEADQDYASVGFILHGPDGHTYPLPNDENYPEAAEDAVIDDMLALRTTMTDDGQQPWYTARFTVNQDGKFDLNFGYEQPQP